MANRKKLRHEKKKPSSFSIKTGVDETFRTICDVHNINPSEKVEELLQTFNKHYQNAKTIN